MRRDPRGVRIWARVNISDKNKGADKTVIPRVVVPRERLPSYVLDVVNESR